MFYVFLFEPYNAAKTVVALCSIPVTFVQEAMYVITCLTQKLLNSVHLDTKYIPENRNIIRYNLSRVFTRLKSAEK